MKGLNQCCGQLAAMKTIDKMIDNIRQYLANLPPLSITSTRRIYNVLKEENPNINCDYLRAAVQRVSLGSTRADSKGTKVCYAIFLKLEEMKQENLKDTIYLSLSGIKKSFINNMSSDYVKSIKDKLSCSYGSQAIRYWVQSTQLNSMDQINSREKKIVRQRENGECRICVGIKEMFAQANKSLPLNLNQGKLKVCHIVSRSSVFWYLLERVHDEGLNIFSDEGIIRFRSLLKSDPLHGNAKFMILLCHKHDVVVQNSLKIKN